MVLLQGGSPQLSSQGSWQGPARAMGSWRVPLAPTAGEEDAGLALQRARSPGSRAAVLLSIVIQPYRHTVNASFQLHRHVANTQNSTASAPNGLSGLYWEEIAEDTAAARGREAHIFSWADFAPSLCHPDHDTCVSMVNPPHWVRWRNTRARWQHGEPFLTACPSDAGKKRTAAEGANLAALLWAYQKPNQLNSSLLKMKLHLKE